MDRDKETLRPVRMGRYTGTLVREEPGGVAGRRPYGKCRSGQDRMQSKPNIVVVLADDMGYGDVTCFDPAHNKVPTPNIDHLAAEGMSFTNTHATSALCTPSRYGLLTGRYAWRSRLQRGVLMVYGDELIEPGRLTMPEMLRRQGYHTGCVGKWHLGWRWPRRDGEVIFDGPIPGGPVDHGFNEFFGVDVPNFPPYAWIEGDRVQGTPSEHMEIQDDIFLHFDGPAVPGWQFDHILPTITGKAVDFISQHAGDDQPFFLYFPLTTPHEPISPSPRFKGKSGISGVADLIMETDWALGEVMHALDEQGIADNTLLIFTSDNGHCPYTELSPFEQVGHRVSGPYRGYKADIWEGGHRVPFVARWPQVVPADSKCNQLMSLVDLTATCAAISGASIPETAAEDSVDALPLLQGQDRPIRDAAIFHSGRGFFAVLKDNWKLSLCPDSGGLWNPEQLPEDLPPVQLHDLANDEAEQHNVQDHHPELVVELTHHIEQAVANGRTTPGPTLHNDVEVDIWKLPDETPPRAPA